MRSTLRRTHHTSGPPNERAKFRVVLSSLQDLRNWFRSCSSHSPCYSDLAERDVYCKQSLDTCLRRAQFGVSKHDNRLVFHERIRPVHLCRLPRTLASSHQHGHFEAPSVITPKQLLRGEVNIVICPGSIPLPFELRRF